MKYLITHKFTLNRLTRIFIGFRAQISCSHFYYPQLLTENVHFFFQTLILYISDAFITHLKLLREREREGNEGD